MIFENLWRTSKRMKKDRHHVYLKRKEQKKLRNYILFCFTSILRKTLEQIIEQVCLKA